MKAKWEILEPGRRIHRLILESAVSEIEIMILFDTDYDHMEDLDDSPLISRMMSSKSGGPPVLTKDEVQIKVGDYLLTHMLKAIKGHADKGYTESRLPMCIPDMANLFFDCSQKKLMGKKGKHFSRIPLYQNC